VPVRSLGDRLTCIAKRPERQAHEDAEPTRCPAVPCRLSLAVGNLGAQLPDIHPGALPALELLVLAMAAQRATLPPSWGASPQVLPCLLKLTIIFDPQGRLPREWARGFKHLRILTLLDSRHEFQHTRRTWWRPMPEPAPAMLLAAQQEQAAPGGMTLPPEWSSGFPRLTDLVLSGLPLAGPFPQAWQTGGFPALVSL
jgi:hypothetical protein